MYKRNQVFAAACIALLLFGMTLITLGSIMPSLTARFESLGLNKALLVFIYPIGILAGSLVFGPFVDRYGYKLLLIVSVLISAISLEGLAFAQSLPLFYLCIFLNGFGGGIINGGTSALVADISVDNKGANLSLLGVFFGIGAFGMPFLLGVLSEHFAYTSILAAVGLFMLLPVFWFIFILFPAPKQAQGFPLKEALKLLKEPALLLTAFFLFFQSGVESLSNNWTTTFLQHTLQTTNTAALYALSFMLAAFTVARLLLGSLLKKVSPFSVMLISLLAVIAGCLMLMYAGYFTIAVIALIIVYMGLAAGFPVILGYVGQLYAHLSGTAFSIALVIALTGNSIINYLFGLIVEKYSVRHLPLAIMSCIACMLVILFVIKRTIKGRIKL